MRTQKIKLCAILLILFSLGCEKNDKPDMDTLELLYKNYKTGEIDQCKLNGKIVFCAGSNAFDAPAIIYDNSGKLLGECNYAWGPVDEICKKLTDCEVIYRCENHITGEPPVNKYNLGN